MPPARMARTSKGRLWNSGQKETRQGCDPDGLNRGPLQRKVWCPQDEDASRETSEPGGGTIWKAIG